MKIKKYVFSIYITYKNFIQFMFYKNPALKKFFVCIYGYNEPIINIRFFFGCP